MKLAIDRVILRTIDIPLREPFRTGLGTVNTRQVVIVEVYGEGLSGFGECAVLPLPGYSSETPQSAAALLAHHLAPGILSTSFASPTDLAPLLAQFPAEPIACAGLEMACWDWWAKRLGQPLYKVLGGTRSVIQVGVAVPLFDDPAELVGRIDAFRREGYARIKIKLEPGRESVCALIREQLGAVPLMVDANGAYTAADLPRLKALDSLGLMMIEQPFAAHEIDLHAALQRAMKTPICLDESIDSVRSANDVLDRAACRSINIKPGRVGGLSAARAIHDAAAARGIGVWCGGLLETGIGRRHNIALAALPNFVYPGDISASARYFETDIITPPVTLGPGGTIALSEEPGIGCAVDAAALERWTISLQEINR